MYEQNNSMVIESVPLKERNLFQRYLMEKMGVRHGDPKSQTDWSVKYARIVSNIIDDKNREDHEMIRTLIGEGKYEEASRLFFEDLKEFEE